MESRWSSNGENWPKRCLLTKREEQVSVIANCRFKNEQRKSSNFASAGPYLKRQSGQLLVMTIHLKPEHEQQIIEALRSGAYNSTEDVIDRALEVLHERDEWLLVNRQTIDAKIHRGIAELERGEGIPEDELDKFLENLKTQPE